MQRIPVESSNIASIGYEPQSMILEIEFHSGRIYRYYDVPEVQYSGLISSGSKGRYLHQNIINIYRDERVS